MIVVAALQSEQDLIQSNVNLVLSLWKTAHTVWSEAFVSLYWWPHCVFMKREHGMTMPVVIRLFIVFCLNLSIIGDTQMNSNGNKPVAGASVMAVFTGEPTEDPVGPGRATFPLHKCNVLMLMDHRSK